ncbi:MAG: 8-oxo-dGTP diphosphatase [Thermoleophilaceae bacterium]|jgi:8-oxo-dGTP diphosphatase|nr:8-oxo-dGTP diphosphatase [Thermoleophilaceae bacterium]
MSAEVLAAGGAVWRPLPGGGGIELALVHRPRYDDWSLPKGKLDEGESFEQAARREVEEETGLRCELGDFLGETTYTDHKDREKLVRFWAMEAGEGEFEPDDEVDELRWVPIGEAEAILSYEFDRELVRGLAKLGLG